MTKVGKARPAFVHRNFSKIHVLRDIYKAKPAREKQPFIAVFLKLSLWDALPHIALLKPLHCR